MMVVGFPELVDAERRLGVRPVQDFQKTKDYGDLFQNLGKGTNEDDPKQ